MSQWYGAGRSQKLIRRAEMFSRARSGDRGAIEPLLAILAERSEGFIARANAAGHMSRFADDSRVSASLERALGDPEPLVRADAAVRIESEANGTRPCVD